MGEIRKIPLCGRATRRGDCARRRRVLHSGSQRDDQRRDSESPAERICTRFMCRAGRQGHADRRRDARHGRIRCKRTGCGAREGIARQSGAHGRRIRRSDERLPRRADPHMGGLFRCDSMRCAVQRRGHVSPRSRCARAMVARFARGLRKAAGGDTGSRGGAFSTRRQDCIFHLHIQYGGKRKYDPRVSCPTSRFFRRGFSSFRNRRFTERHNSRMAAHRARRWAFCVQAAQGGTYGSPRSCFRHRPRGSRAAFSIIGNLQN